MYLRLSNFEAALQDCEIATERIPDYVAVYLLLGDAYYGLGDLENARTAYSTFLERNGGGDAEDGRAQTRIDEIDSATTTPNAFELDSSIQDENIIAVAIQEDGSTGVFLRRSDDRIEPIHWRGDEDEVTELPINSDTDLNVAAIVYNTNDETIFMVGGGAEQFYLWSTSLNIYTNIVHSYGQTTLMSFSPCGCYMLSAHDTRLILWDWNTDEALHDFSGAPNPFTAITVSDSYVAASAPVGDGTSVVGVWSVETGEEVASFTIDGINSVTALTFAQYDDNVLVIGANTADTNESALYLWDVNSNQQLNDLGILNQTTLEVAVNSNNVLFAITAEGGLWYFDLGNGYTPDEIGENQGLTFLISDSDSNIVAAAINSEADTILIAREDGTLERWAIP
jgi:WD40 repeat protein